MSYQFLSRKGTLIAFLTTLVLVVITLIPIIGGLSDFEAVPENQQAISEEGNIFSAGLYLAAILLALCVVVAIVFSLFQVVSNPKGSLRGLIALGALAVLFIFLFAMADAKGSGALATTIETFGVGSGISKTISAGLMLSLILGLGAVVIGIILEVLNYFKNQ